MLASELLRRAVVDPATGLVSFADGISVPSIPGGPPLIGLWETAPFDFLAAAADHTIIMPLAAGKVFVPCFYHWRALAKNAAVVTTLTWGYAHNGTLITAASANPSAAQYNLLSTLPTAFTSIITSTTPAMDNFPLVVRVTVPASGSGLTTFNGTAGVWGYYRDA
jgi:hypothetical protein